MLWREIIYLIIKEFRVMIIKMLKLGKRMDEHRTSTKIKQYKKGPTRSHKTEEYNNWNEKYTRGVLQQTR